jgi:hypothetical protein
VKHLDGVSGRSDGAPVCPGGYFGCPNDTVDSSGCSFFLSGRACFCDLYVALRSDGESCRVKLLSPRAVAHFFAFFGSFLSSCAFPLCFLCATL